MGLAKAVFLDRDGVLNEALVRNGKPYPPSNRAELRIIPAAFSVLKKLKLAGFKLIVVTNQPDVARGVVTRQWVEEINGYLQDQLPLDVFKVCFHDDLDGCSCRKPLPGALLEAAKEFEIDLGLSYMVGDRWKDISAGKAAGCKTIFIDYGYLEKQPTDADFVVNTLSAVEHIILGEKSEKS